jgi:hypothetical protein
MVISTCPADLTSGSTWAEARNPLIRTVEIMVWLCEYYGKDYKPNTRETTSSYRHGDVSRSVSITSRTRSSPMSL